jgi:UDP:flavonoid glycosyltransferase YjiC (YdhE family)
MNILFITLSPPLPTKGSMVRLLSLYNEFNKKGHSSFFCASGVTKEMLLQKKCKVFDIPETKLFGIISGFKNTQKIKPPYLKNRSIGNVWLLLFLLGMLNKKYLAKLVSELMKIINRTAPDLLITELNAGAYIAAKITGIPLLTTFANVALEGKKTLFWHIAKKNLNKILKDRNIENIKSPEDLFMDKKTAKIIPSVPELDGFTENRPDVLYVGKLETALSMSDPNFQADNTKRYIFVYMGVGGSIPYGTMKKVLPEVFNPYKNIICVVASGREETQIGNVFFYRFFPFVAIIGHTDLVISHGGLNTITESLSAGIPLLLFPGSFFEVRYNAMMVEKNGLGYMGEKRDFNALWIKEKYEHIGTITPEVNKFKQKYQEYGGAKKAVEYAEFWAQKRLR